VHQLRQAVVGVVLAGYNFLSIGEQSRRAVCRSVCTGLQFWALGLGNPYRYRERCRVGRTANVRKGSLSIHNLVAR